MLSCKGEWADKGIKSLPAGVLAPQYSVNLHIRSEGFRKTYKTLEDK